MKVVDKKLPPRVVAPPIRQQSQAAQRIIFIFILLTIGVFGITQLDFTGKVTETTVNVTQVINSDCSILLENGLNIVSMNCITNNEDRDAVLANTDLNLITAIYQYRNKQADQWHVYNPALPSYVVQDLTAFSRLKGYLFYLTGNTLIEYNGTLAATSVVPVYQDNNLVGYPSILEDPLPGALTTLQDTYSRVRTYNGTSWIEFNSTDGSAGGLSNLTPTTGYWITTSAPDAWQVAHNSS